MCAARLVQGVADANVYFEALGQLPLVALPDLQTLIGAVPGLADGRHAAHWPRLVLRLNK